MLNYFYFGHKDPLSKKKKKDPAKNLISTIIYFFLKRIVNVIRYGTDLNHEDRSDYNGLYKKNGHAEFDQSSVYPINTRYITRSTISLKLLLTN